VRVLRPGNEVPLAGLHHQLEFADIVPDLVAAMPPSTFGDEAVRPAAAARLYQPKWVRIFGADRNLIDSARLVSEALSGSIASG
jgi:hypothetical protein